MEQSVMVGDCPSETGANAADRHVLTCCIFGAGAGEQAAETEICIPCQH
jgi:hypothetical protein